MLPKSTLLLGSFRKSSAVRSKNPRTKPAAAEIRIACRVCGARSPWLVGNLTKVFALQIFEASPDYPAFSSM